MIERTPKIRLKKIVRIANSIHDNPDDPQVERRKKELQESLWLIQHLDYIVLSRSSFPTDNTKKKVTTTTATSLKPRAAEFCTRHVFLRFFPKQLEVRFRAYHVFRRALTKI